MIINLNRTSMKKPEFIEYVIFIEIISINILNFQCYLIKHNILLYELLFV